MADQSAALERTSSLLREHLKSAGVPSGPQVWTLAQSPLGGRGVIATRDIAAGELVLSDAPLVLGPRAGLHSPPLCVGCHQGSCHLQPCSRGCGLPVCSTPCEDVPHHQQECERLRDWGVTHSNTWSPELLRACTPVRCLGLSPLQRHVLQCLQSHSGSQHAFEIDLLKRNTEKGPSDEEEDFMRLACFVMDANAFETAQVPKEVLKKKSTEEMRPLNALMPSVRGLYPLAAMMNHACTPNTMHCYNQHQIMIVRAASNIAAGTEITNSYTALLWGSPARRHHLQLTKHFLCSCPRCGDPQEGGSRLAALKCPSQDCGGSLFPVEPLDEESKWQCERCERNVTGRQAALTQATLGRLLGAIDCKNPVQMERFLNEHHHIVSTSNQVVVEVKCSLIRIYGHKKGYSWSEISVEQLELKERLCRELLQLLVILGAGICRMRGLLLYELHCTLMELHRRRCEAVRSLYSGDDIIQELCQEALVAIQEAVHILRDDITAPIDIACRLEKCKEVVFSI